MSVYFVKKANKTYFEPASVSDVTWYIVDDTPFEFLHPIEDDIRHIAESLKLLRKPYTTVEPIHISNW